MNASLLRTSFHLIEPNKEAFAETFYRCLLESRVQAYEMIAHRSAELLSFSTPSGEQVTVNPHILSQTMDRFSVREWQIVQMHEGLRVLLRGEQGEQQDEALRQALQRALASQGVHVPPIWIGHVAVIPRNESGKVIPIVSAF